MVQCTFPKIILKQTSRRLPYMTPSRLKFVQDHFQRMEKTYKTKKKAKISWILINFLLHFFLFKKPNLWPSAQFSPILVPKFRQFYLCWNVKKVKIRPVPHILIFYSDKLFTGSYIIRPSVQFSHWKQGFYVTNGLLITAFRNAF